MPRVLCQPCLYKDPHQGVIHRETLPGEEILQRQPVRDASIGYDLHAVVEYVNGRCDVADPVVVYAGIDPRLPERVPVEEFSFLPASRTDLDGYFVLSLYEVEDLIDLGQQGASAVILPEGHV